MRAQRTGRIGLPGLLPDLRGQRLLTRRGLDLTVQPHVPFGRRPARLDVAVIDHPAPIALLRAVIDVALIVATDFDTATTGMQPRAERRTVPPGEDRLEPAHSCPRTR